MKVIEKVTELAYEARQHPYDSPSHAVLYKHGKSLLPNTGGFRQGCIVKPTKSAHEIVIKFAFWYRHEGQDHGLGYMEAIVTPRVFLNDLKTVGVNIKIQWDSDMERANLTNLSNTVCKKYWDDIKGIFLKNLFKEIPK